MIKINDELKSEQKHNKFVKHNNNVQRAKKVAGAIASGTVVVLAGTIKYGKELIQHIKK